MQKNHPPNEESSHLRSSTDTKLQKNDLYTSSKNSLMDDQILVFLLIRDHTPVRTPVRTESEADDELSLSSSSGISRFGSQTPASSIAPPPPSYSSIFTNKLYPTSLDSEYEELLNDYELCAGLFRESAERVYKLKLENTALRLVRNNRLDLLNEVDVHRQHSAYISSGFPLIDDDATSVSSIGTGGFMNYKGFVPSSEVPVTSPTAVDDDKMYQQLWDDYSLCFAHLEDSMKRADILSEANAALRLIILDLEYRLVEVSSNHLKIHSIPSLTTLLGHGTGGFGIITRSRIWFAIDGCEKGINYYDERDHSKKRKYIKYDSVKWFALGNQRKQPQIFALCSGSCVWYNQIISRLLKKIENEDKIGEDKNRKIYTPHSAAVYAKNFMRSGYRDPKLPKEVQTKGDYADIIFLGFVDGEPSMFLATYGDIKEVRNSNSKLKDGEVEDDFYWNICTLGTGGVHAGDFLLEEEEKLANDDNPLESTSKIVMDAMKFAVDKDDDTDGIISIGYLTSKAAVVKKYDAKKGYKKVGTETINNLKRKAPPGK